MLAWALLLLSFLSSRGNAQTSSDNEWVRCRDGQQDLDLSSQFPPTTEQRFGDCVVHAEAGLLEAAFHRSARGDAELGQVLVGKRLDRSTIFLDSLLSSGPKHINIESFIAGYGACESLARNSRAGIPWSTHKLFGGAPMSIRPNNAPVADLIFCGDQSCSVRTASDYVDDEALEKIINSELIQACENAKRDGREMQGSDVITALKATRLKISELGKMAPDEEELNRRLHETKKSFTRHTLKPKGPEPHARDLIRHSETSFRCASSPSQRERAQDMKKILRSYLCSEVPVAATIRTEAGPGFEVSDDAGFSWHQTEHESPELHRVVVIGTERRNGKDYYLLRNSQKKGSAETPDASYMRIAAEDACRIFDLRALVTPADESSLVRRVFAISGGLADQVVVENTAAIRRALEERGANGGSLEH